MHCGPVVAVGDVDVVRIHGGGGSVVGTLTRVFNAPTSSMPCRGDRRRTPSVRMRSHVSLCGTGPAKRTPGGVGFDQSSLSGCDQPGASAAVARDVTRGYNGITLRFDALRLDFVSVRSAAETTSGDRTQSLQGPPGAEGVDDGSKSPTEAEGLHDGSTWRLSMLEKSPPKGSATHAHNQNKSSPLAAQRVPGVGRDGSNLSHCDQLGDTNDAGHGLHTLRFATLQPTRAEPVDSSNDWRGRERTVLEKSARAGVTMDARAQHEVSAGWASWSAEREPHGVRCGQINLRWRYNLRELTEAVGIDGGRGSTWPRFEDDVTVLRIGVAFGACVSLLSALLTAWHESRCVRTARGRAWSNPTPRLV